MARLGLAALSRRRKGELGIVGGTATVVGGSLEVLGDLKLLKDVGVLEHVSLWILIVLGIGLVLWAILAPVKDDDSGPGGGHNVASADNQSQAGVTSGAHSPVTNIDVGHIGDVHNYPAPPAEPPPRARGAPTTIVGGINMGQYRGFVSNRGDMGDLIAEDNISATPEFLINTGTMGDATLRRNITLGDDPSAWVESVRAGERPWQEAAERWRKVLEPLQTDKTLRAQCFRLVTEMQNFGSREPEQVLGVAMMAFYEPLRRVKRALQKHCPGQVVQWPLQPTQLIDLQNIADTLRLEAGCLRGDEPPASI